MVLYARQNPRPGALESIIFKYYYLYDDIVTALIVLLGMLVLNSYYY
jgi:hypothetical protein